MKLQVLVGCIGAAMVGMALGRCATERPRPERPSGPQFEVMTGETAAGARFRAASFIEGAPAEVVYRSWDDGDGRLLRTVRAEREGDAWTLRAYIRTEGGAEEKLVREDEQELNAQGEVVLPRSVDYTEGVTTVFEPALLALPAELVQDEPVAQEVRMTVRPRNDPSKVRARGPVTNEVTYLGREEVRTPRGRFEAAHVRSVFRADLGGTKVRSETEQWLVEGMGVVAERRSERATLLGVPVRNIQESWVLEENRPETARPSDGERGE